ncbi:fosfomycin resistance glutathione transferase [Microbulbifer epialgicus]|uniref:Fosfomycin resistance glutathione transferase n=1 Tax=Microbulbifer epialgicus TaxID=393907 RepID=A0ABV4P570_9GAMM
MLKSLNHITIAVKNLEKSFEFYVELLGMKPHAKWTRGAYLSLDDLWFCLSVSVDKSSPSQDYTHIAFEIDIENINAMRERLQVNDVPEWKKNSSEGDSIYFLDPDGHKLEVHCGSLQTRLESLKVKPYEGLKLY